MSRELKFRAWDGKDMLNIDHRTLSMICEHIPENHIIEQYTGLKDKNGKGAYRDDKVKSKHYGKGTIIWWGNGWAIESDDQGKDGIHFSLDYEFEIIGNIHDKENSK